MDQLQHQREDRDQEQDKLLRLYIRVPFEVMLDDRLTLADKFVFGRALCFHEFYESVERTAAFIGISVTQAQKSKQKLEKLGLIQCVADDGRGKKYIAELDPGRLAKSANRLERLAKSANQPSTNNQAASQNLPTEYKERLKKEEKESFKDKSLKDAPEAPASEPLKEESEQPARYGKAEINELLDLWQEQTGFSHHGTKAERYAINNLLRKNGYEATKALIRRVGTARRSDDQFAPQIAKPSQLQGKYSKLEALTMWEERQHKQTEDTNHPDFNLLYPVAHLDDYDYRGNKTKEELHADAQSIRDKWAGTKYERIFKRRSEDEGEDA